MAKFKPAGSKRSNTSKSNWRALPCLLIILVIVGIVTLLFYEVLKSGI